MKALPCYSKLGFTPPGGNSSGTFFEPNYFPTNGTATTSNIAGTITSPVNGTLYTWTYNGVERTVTIASADATPTSTTGTGGSGDKKNDAPSIVSRLLPISYGLLFLINMII